MQPALLRTAVVAVFCCAMAAAAPNFQFNIISVANNQPGQTPVITFSVTDPSNNNHPYDIKSDPAFTASLSRLTVQLGWDTRDYQNTGSGSEFSSPAAAAQPISVEALRASFASGNGAFTVVSTASIPATATGTGVATLEGRVAARDAAGGYTITTPVTMAYSYFPITGTAIVPRRQVVDRSRCNTCHDTISVHGNNRTDELHVCVVCHNPNATDIPYRQFADGPEQPIDFKYMIHAIHAGAFRQNPFKVIGFGHSVNDFSGVRFGQPYIETCEACHIPGANQVPLQSNVLGTTTVTNSILTATQKTVDNLPDNNLRMTPTAAACSACHDSAATRTHMEQNGASFNALQLNIDSGAVKELCANCHGTGKPLDVVNAHLEGLTPTSPRLTSISQNSGVINSSVPVKITGTNLSSAGLTVTGVGVTVSNLVRTATLLTATLNIAANATLGPRTVMIPGADRGLPFTVRPPAPALLSLSPSGGTPGATIPVMLAGTNLTGATLSVSSTSATVSNVTAGASQISATLAISSTATGYVILTATTAGGVSNGVVLTINSAGVTPTLTSIAPASGTAGTTVPVTITGTNLTGAILNIGGTGVTASNVVAAATQITASLTLASNATAGVRTISATTAAGTSNSISFTVNALTPALSSITPASGTAGTSVPITITGTNLTGATLNIGGAGVTASNVVAAATQITASLTLASNATAGVRTISATTAAGTSNSVNFTVNSPSTGLPTAASVFTPFNGNLGQNIAVVLTGTNFVPGATTVTFVVGTGVAATNITVVSSTKLTATLNVAANASEGDHFAIVTTPAGSSSSRVYFEVFGMPSISTISPVSIANGTSVQVTLNGKNFSSDCVIGISGTGVSTGNRTITKDGTVLQFTVTATGAAAGARSLTVTNSVGASNAVTLTVQ